MEPHKDEVWVERKQYYLWVHSDLTKNFNAKASLTELRETI